MEIEIFIEHKERKIWISSKVHRKIRIDVSNLDSGKLLYTGHTELSPDYRVWIAPSAGVGYKDPWVSGMIISLYSGEDFITQKIYNSLEGKKKILYVSSHLSTGGMPQYLFKQIESFITEYSIYCVEFSQITGGVYVVQRNRIMNLLGEKRFHSMGEDKMELMKIIEEINPEIVHLQEFSEDFIPPGVIKSLYNKNRNYYIIETTHSSYSEPSDKEFIPDRYVFASRYSFEKFRVFDRDTDMDVWEYPIETKTRPDRNMALKKIGLDPNKVHVLNVGLFTPGKNQGEAFNIAREFDSNVEFHFVGNQASNFHHYWGPIMKNKPDNCFVWGEKENIDDYMSACDIFLFTSKLELNPLVVKEALSWQMPSVLYDLHTYAGAYQDNPLVSFMDHTDKKINVEIVSRLVEKVKTNINKKISLYHIMNSPLGEIENKSIIELKELCESIFEYKPHVTPLATEIEEVPYILPFQTMDSFKNGHWGCFKSFRSCIMDAKESGNDFVIICERDCSLLADNVHIRDKISEACDLMNEHGIDIFSFGDTKDLDHGYEQSDYIRDISDWAFLTNKIIGLQFQIFSKDGIEFLCQTFERIPWNGMDIWLNEVYGRSPERKRAIVKKRLTTQFDGVSTIDGGYKKFL
jgi:glycosyltransferase involved in cell wall biosynthesis